MDGRSFRRSATTCTAGITREYPGIFGGYFLNYSSLFKHFWLVKQGNMRPRLIGIVTSFPWSYCYCCCVQVILPENKHGWYPSNFKFWVDFDVVWQAVLGSSSHVTLPTFQKETPVFAISLSMHSTRSTPLSHSPLSLEVSSSASGDAASSSELWRFPHLHPSSSIFRASFYVPCHCHSFLLLEISYHFPLKLCFVAINFIRISVILFVFSLFLSLLLC